MTQTIYLHGGNNASNIEIYFEQVRKILHDIRPTQCLLVPFSRTGIQKRSSKKLDGWMEREYGDLDIQFLNGRYREDIDQFEPENGLVLMPGGNDNVNLCRQIQENEMLHEKVMSSRYIFGDSAGMMIVGKQFRKKDDYDDHMQGLGLIDAIGEPHCTERDRITYLSEYREKYDVKYIIGIDENTVLEMHDGVPGEHWGDGMCRILER